MTSQHQCRSTRRHVGRRSELWGRAAEDAVARVYEQRGGAIVARRERTEAGEIDLAVLENDALVVVEVKARRCASDAARAVRPAAWRRLGAAAEVFAARVGRLDHDLRLDLATVDRSGHVAIFENAGMDALVA